MGLVQQLTNMQYQYRKSYEQFCLGVQHRRRMETEARAKVVASV